MKVNRFSRRAFLQGSGGFLLALPFLESMIPRAAWAANGGVPKRFVAFRSEGGCHLGQFWPASDPTNAFASDVSYQDLRTVTGDISQVLTAARFGALRSKLNVCRGLDLVGVHGHNRFTMLSGSRVDEPEPPNAVTLDRILAKSSKIYSSEPITRALNLRPFYTSYQSDYWSMSVDNSGGTLSIVPNYWNEVTAFNAIFGLGSPQPVPMPQPTPMPSSGGGSPAPTPVPTPNTASIRAQNRIKVVDRVFADFQSLKNANSISSADKATIDNHMTLLSQLENKLKALAPAATTSLTSTAGSTTSAAAKATAVMGSCSTPTLADSHLGADLSTWDMQAGYRNHIDLMVAALACGATNIGTIMALVNPFFDSDFSHFQIGHQLAQYVPQQLQVSGFYADMFSYLLTKMDAIVEANGRTLLDNSLVFWSSELADPTIAHGQISLPVVLGGGLQGYMKTGYYVDYRQRPNLTIPNYGSYTDAIGRPYNQLLVTILQGMGLSPADYEQGQTGFGNYAVDTGDNSFNAAAVFAPYFTDTVKRSPLPFLV